MKKLLLCLALALICIASLFAVQANVTWTWYENDSDVQFYRFQLDAQEDDGWTVVGNDVNEITLLLDVSQAHSLYLQQSYDGQIWSESSVVESEIFTDFGSNNEEAVVEEESLQPEEVQPEAEPATSVAAEELSEEKAEETAEPEKKTPSRAFEYGLGYLNTIPDSKGPKTAGAFVSYSMPLKEAEVFKIGFKANLAVFASKELFTHFSELSVLSYVNVLAMGVLPLGDGELYLAFGPDAGFNLFSEYSYRIGLSMELGVRYHSSEKTSFGLAVADHQYLFPSDKMENRFDFRVFMGTVF